MSNKKLSSFDAVTTVDDADEFYVARSGEQKKITGADLKAAAGNGGSSSPLAIVSMSVAYVVEEPNPTLPTIYGVPYDTVDYDPDGLWDSDNNFFRAAETGWYQCRVTGRSDSGILSDECLVEGLITVNGPGVNIFNPVSVSSTTDAAAFILLGWSGITHLRAGDSVEVDLVTGSPTGNPDPCRLVVVGSAFEILMVRAGT